MEFGINSGRIWLQFGLGSQKGRKSGEDTGIHQVVVVREDIFIIGLSNISNLNQLYIEDLEGCSTLRNFSVKLTNEYYPYV